MLEPTTRKMVRSEYIGERPDMLAISPDGSKLYVTIRGEDKMLVLSSDDLSTLAEVATGDEPHGVAYRAQ